MYSIAFPKMVSSTTCQLYEGHKATASNLKLMLLSDKYALLGDPYFGTNLKKLMFELNNQVLIDLVVDDIYLAIKTFMPQLIVERDNIEVTSDKAKVYINIKGTNLLDYQTDMYNISLTQDEVI